MCVFYFKHNNLSSHKTPTIGRGMQGEMIIQIRKTAFLCVCYDHRDS